MVVPATVCHQAGSFRSPANQWCTLFECIDRLENAKDERQRELAVYFVMDELKDYARIHFAVEEIIMRLFDYPGLEAHIAEHGEFTARLKSLGKIELNHDVHAEAGSFLRGWLTKHIMISDKRYAEFILGQHASRIPPTP